MYVKGSRLWGDLLGHQFFAVVVDGDDRAGGRVFGDDLAGDQGLDVRLDEPLQRAGAVLRVEGRVDHVVLGGVGQRQVELACLHAFAEVFDQQVDDAVDVLLGQRLVVDDLVETVQELGTEGPF